MPRISDTKSYIYVKVAQKLLVAHNLDTDRPFKGTLLHPN